MTGNLHMGHMFEHTESDILDSLAAHAGREGALDSGHRPRRHCHADAGGAAGDKRGTSRQKLGREAFVERVWEWRGTTAARFLAR